jgi:hypothetical protein
LPGGSQSATVTATDTTGLSATDSISFTIDAGVTATLTEHINAGRLDYATSYSACYLEYGAAAFKVIEVATANGQCRWQDSDASCVGPVQACSGGGTPDPDPEPQPECEAFTTYNYYHKTAGRAYSTGYYLSPDYFAKGSDEAMAGSTWGLTTLHSNDGAVWHVGACE